MFDISRLTIVGETGVPPDLKLKHTAIAISVTALTTRACGRKESRTCGLFSKSGYGGIRLYLLVLHVGPNYQPTKLISQFDYPGGT